MFFLWGKKSGDEVLDNGFINCPHCRKRTPAVLTKYVESTHIYFIPISSTESPERVRCEECGGYFGNNEQTAFGHLEKEPDWNCFKCEKPIPHSRIDCPHCGFRFTR
jgi:DNA-directed RNA polymerase subunit RPC12/RpoP